MLFLKDFYKKTKDSFYSPAIDSMTVITPLDAFDFIPERITTNVLEVTEIDGEILSSKKKPVFLEIEGVKYRIFVFSLFGKEHLSITYNSKMLTHTISDTSTLHLLYTRGISSSNFLDIFRSVRSQFNFSIGYHSYLLHSKVFDCDIFCDFYMFYSDYSELLLSYKHHKLKSFRSPSNDVVEFNNDPFNQKVLSGIQFVNRKDASISQPFIKFYSKIAELKSRSTEYYNLLLTKTKRVSFDDEISLRRFEATIKNSKHFQSLGIDNNLESVLNLQPNELATVLDSLISRYLDTNLSPKKIEQKIKSSNVEKPTPYVFMLGKMATILMQENNFSFQQIVNFYDDLPGGNANSKSRLKSRLKKSIAFYMKLEEIYNLRVTAKDAFFD